MIKEFKKLKSNFYKDNNLLNHFAYQHMRDGLIIFPDKIKKGCVDSTLDYDLINS